LTARLSLGGNLAGTVMLAIAAYAPARAVRTPRRRLWLYAAGLGLGLAGLAALMAGALGHGLVEGAIAVGLVLAAVGLARRAAERDEALLRWAAVAVVLGGFAVFDSALFPAADTGSVRLGDALRILGWVALLAGVLMELRTRLAARTTAAVECERRRLARELHDGVAQELAFIRRRAGRLATEADGIEILDAAERALEDSRRAIEALVPPAHQPLHVAMERLGARLAVECGVEVQVDVRDTEEISDDVRSELLKIVSEAVRNAAHHGGARHVQVVLQGAPLAVRVIDDGCGFRDGASSGLGVAGYGLIAMRERAEQVGAKFSLESVRDAGTLVQVVLP
jgi:signal transduction histidine kinase